MRCETHKSEMGDTRHFGSIFLGLQLDTYSFCTVSLSFLHVKISMILRFKERLRQMYMWHWDQGHLPYFQFDALRQMASFVVSRDFKTATRAELLAATGLDFAAPPTYTPWRNYARVLKLCLLVSESDSGGYALPTPVAALLATPGQTTCDEYFHFIARSFTEPSPALAAWTPEAPSRFPLLFCLKYLLAKRAITRGATASLGELIEAYKSTGFVGDEDDTSFIQAVGLHQAWNGSLGANEYRQERESLRVLCQISYLHLEGSKITISLDPADAQEIFKDLSAVTGPKAVQREAEIRRLAELFRNGALEDFYEYPHTAVNDVIQSGFAEGSKVKRTHLVIERNQELRRAFFDANTMALCDVCSLNTGATYPWTTRVLDLHHLLPLASGTRVIQTGTSFEDLVPVCPSCHRAVHRFYDGWLAAHQLQDFMTNQQARDTYFSMKASFGGPIYG